MAKAVEQEPVAVDDLLLDAQNPRLPEGLREASQDELLRYMEEMYDLEEIGYSMARRGYFEEEPLLTVPLPDRSDKRVVVEGNRRLATLKLLTDPVARAAIGAKRVWEELAQAAKESGHDLTPVPTRHYEDRGSLLEYLGFRHVSGLMQWTPEAKARYVYSLVTEHGYSFYEAGRAIGSRRDAINRQFVAYGALLQGRSADIDVSPALQRFGVYYRSLQNPGIRSFLQLKGWSEGSPQDVTPVGEPQHLAELIDWVFVSRVVRESRDLDSLGKAVRDPTSLALLRETGDLQAALDELPADRDAVLAALRLAYRNLGKAYAEIHEFQGDERLAEEVSRIERLLDRVRESIVAPQGS